MIDIKGSIEVLGIGREAAVEVYKDTRLWLGRVITNYLQEKDTRLADACNLPEDEL